MPTFLAQTLSDEQVKIFYDAQPSVGKSGGLKRLKQRRARNHRLQIVRNTVNKADVTISVEHKVRREDGRYVLTVQGSGQAFPLPKLDYGPWKEMRNIWVRVLRDIMSKNDALEIKASLAALHSKVDGLDVKVTGLDGKFDTFSAETKDSLQHLKDASAKILKLNMS